MADGVRLAQEIQSVQQEIEVIQTVAADNEYEFASAMGDMLREGYWSDEQYIAGQEDSLYADALEISKQMAYPTQTWTVDVRDLEFTPVVNQMVRIYDEATR